MNTAFSLLTKVQGALFSYVSTLLILRSISVESYGLYTVLFIGTIANAGMLGKLGLPGTLMRYVPEYFTQSKWRLIRHLFVASNLLQTVFSAILLALAFLLAPRIAGWIQYPDMENLIRIFSVGAFVFLLAENYRVLLSGLFMHREVFYCTLVYNVIRLAAIFSATRSADPFLGVVIAETIVYGVFLLAYYFVYRRRVLPKVHAETALQEPVPWRRFTKYTVLSYVNEIGVMLLNSASDLFLVTGILGSMAVGFYGFAERIMSILRHALPSNFLQGVVTPLFFSEYGSSRENARFGFSLLMKITLFATLPMSVWMILMAKPVIIHLFDPRYADAAAILIVMVLFLPMEAIRYPLSLLLLNAERNDILVYTKFFGVLKIVLGLWLLPIYGVMGMAVLTGLAIFAQNLACYIATVTILGIRTDLRALAKLCMNALISAILLWPLVPLFSGIPGIAASVFVYMALYLGINALIKTFSLEERAMINGKLPRPLWIF